MGEWPLVPIGEIAALYDAPHQTAPLDPDGPVTYLNVGDIRRGRIALSLSGRVSESTAADWTRRVQPRPGDVVFGYEAKVGEAAMLTDDHRWCLGRRVGLLRPRPDRLDPRYLSYAWYSKHFQDTLRAHRIGGTTIESIRLTDLPRWPIALPPLTEQRRIAGILGALDDKIELNRRLAGRLDGAARAIFQQWFIENPAAASWPVIELAALFDVNPSRPLLSTAPAPYLDMANMPTSGPSALGVATRVPGSGARFENGDTLLARITPCLENGKTALVDFLAPGERGWGSTEYIVLRPREPIPEPFAYCLARHPDFVSYAVARMNGSSGRQRVSAAVIGGFQMRTPSPELTTRFGCVVGPMFARITLATAESRTLAQMRDALLPRLLSGDYEVAGREVADVPAGNLT